MESSKGIDGAILVSASGGKHAHHIAKDLTQRGIRCILLTNNPDAPAKEFLDESDVYVFPKVSEPYTYNVSTYLGMLLAKTQEDPTDLKNLLLSLKLPDNLASYKSFFFVLDEKFDAMREMFGIKFHELFGPHVNGRIFTLEQTKHAKTVVQSEKELFVSFGVENQNFGLKKLFLPVPENASYATMMAIAYYFIGAIQKQHPHYFLDSVGDYCKETSEVFGQKIDVIVE